MTAKGENAPTPLGIRRGRLPLHPFQILLHPAIYVSISQPPLRPQANLVMNAA